MASPKATFILFFVIHVISVAVAERIIGGFVVEEYSIKFQGSIQTFDTKTKKMKAYCGCTLISDVWAVSAAHCWRPARLMTVVFGEHQLSVEEGFEQVFNVSLIVVHRYYDYRTFNNDIMLLKLSEPAIINAIVAPAKLPYYNSPPPYWCTVSGWGVTSLYTTEGSDYLRAVDVEIIGKYCNFYYWGRVTYNMLCAGSRYGGKDSCQGDSGGPLMCNGLLEGIVSWGIGCANPYFPGVYTRVRNYVGWIYLTMSENS